MEEKAHISELLVTTSLLVFLAAVGGVDAGVWLPAESAVQLSVCTVSHAMQVVDAQATADVGLARIDITPATQIRLSGYAARTSESVGVQQKLWAKAISIGRGENTCVLITSDCTGLSAAMTSRVKRSLAKTTRISPVQVVLAASHTHSAPMISAYLENLFGSSKYPVTADQQERIDEYTKDLEKKLLQVALRAVRRQSPSLLFWGQGTAGFAKNRRTESGPVDHDLPVLKVADPNGAVRAIVVGYACHGTTLNPADNLVSGDWIGYAQHYIEDKFPGSMAMVVIGAGADSNPHPRGALIHAQQHGREITNEVERVIGGGNLIPIAGDSAARAGTIKLGFAKEDAEPLPYTVQTWTLDDKLAMVFLEGEVVVDYALRLKKYFREHCGEEMLWVNAFCNSVPGYVPSERILNEGGYEADGSTFYYGLPGRFAAGLEDQIVGEVLRQLQDFLKDN